MAGKILAKPVTSKDLDLRGYNDSKIEAALIFEDEKAFNDAVKGSGSKGWLRSFVKSNQFDFKNMFENGNAFRSESVRVVYAITLEDAVQQAPIHDFRGGMSIYEIFVVADALGKRRKFFAKCVFFKEG